MIRFVTRDVQMLYVPPGIAHITIVWTHKYDEKVKLTNTGKSYRAPLCIDKAFNLW